MADGDIRASIYAPRRGGDLRNISVARSDVVECEGKDARQNRMRLNIRPRVVYFPKKAQQVQLRRGPRRIRGFMFPVSIRHNAAVGRRSKQRKFPTGGLRPTPTEIADAGTGVGHRGEDSSAISRDRSSPPMDMESDPRPVD